jgi:hypothetical protein
MPPKTAKERAFLTAREVLDGKVGAVEAARILCGLLHQDSSILSQADFNSIRGIESETDDLPVGRVRELWHPDFLPAKDREIARCEDLYRGRVHAICQRILAGSQSDR